MMIKDMHLHNFHFNVLYHVLLNSHQIIFWYLEKLVTDQTGFYEDLPKIISSSNLSKFLYNFHILQQIYRSIAPALSPHTSVHLVTHMVQTIFSKRFRPYDYGTLKNLQVYGAVEPPDYPLHKISSEIYIYEGQYDTLFSRKVKQIKKLIQNYFKNFLHVRTPISLQLSFQIRNTISFLIIIILIMFLHVMLVRKFINTLSTPLMNIAEVESRKSARNIDFLGNSVFMIKKFWIIIYKG